MLEHVEPRGTDGRTSMWRFAAGFGAVMTAAQLYSGSERRLTLVRPATWKSALGLSSDMQESLTMARDLFPGATDMLARVRDDGRAEALLLSRARLVAVYEITMWRAAAGATTFADIIRKI